MSGPNIINGGLASVESEVQYAWLLDSSGNVLDQLNVVNVTGGTFTVPATTINNGLVAWSGTNGVGMLSPTNATVDSAGNLHVNTLVASQLTTPGTLTMSGSQITFLGPQTSFISSNGAPLMDLTLNGWFPWVDILPHPSLQVGSPADPFLSGTIATVNATTQVITPQITGLSTIYLNGATDKIIQGNIGSTNNLITFTSGTAMSITSANGGSSSAALTWTNTNLVGTAGSIGGASSTLDIEAGSVALSSSYQANTSSITLTPTAITVSGNVVPPTANTYYIGTSGSAFLDVVASGVSIQAPNGSFWTIHVSNAGVLSAVPYSGI